MKHRALVYAASAAITLFLAATTVQAQKVYIDYDKTVDLSNYKTFMIAESTGLDDLSKTSPLAHQHIIDSLRQKLLEGGRLTETKSDPDLVFAYHVTSKQETNVSTTGYGYGFGPGWGGGYYYGGGGWGMADTHVSTYTVGTLLFDAYDVETKKAVWRGIASATVPSNPQKGIKKIDSAIDKLAKKWHDMRAAAGK